MVKRALGSLFALVLVIVFARAALADYAVGDKVEVKWKGKWWPAQVIEVKKDQWKIHYDGYDKSWDEWVKTARIRALKGGPLAPAGDFKAGDKVQVEWKGKWWPAAVLEVKDGKFKIHYDGYDASWDEWVTSNRIKAK
jgi:hypothetical protein